MSASTTASKRLRNRASRGGDSSRSNAMRTSLATGLAGAALLSSLATAPAAAAAEAPPVPDTVTDKGTRLGIPYTDVVYQRPWIRRQPTLAGKLLKSVPDAAAKKVCLHNPVCTRLIRKALDEGGTGALQRAKDGDACVAIRYYGHFVYWGHRVVTADDPRLCRRFVGGSIGVKWMEHGGRNGFLGHALTDEFVTPARPEGRATRFAGGLILWSPRTGAHEVHGSILQHYAELGWENSRLGFPTTDEFALPGGGRQVYFQNGCRIEWRPGVPGRGTFVICNR